MGRPSKGVTKSGPQARVSAQADLTVNLCGLDDVHIVPGDKAHAIRTGRAPAAQNHVRCWIQEDGQWRELDPL